MASVARRGGTAGGRGGKGKADRSEAIEKVVHWAISVAAPSVKADVAALRARYPDKTPKELASKIYTRTAWKAGALGFLTGLPGNPLVALPAGLADSAAILRYEVTAAARVAAIFEPSFLDDPDAAWELLAPLWGINALSQTLRELGAAAGQRLTKQLVRKQLSKGGLRILERSALKIFGRRALIASTSGSATSPTATIVAMAMQRSPAEP